MKDPQAEPETKRAAREWRAEVAARMQTAKIKQAEAFAASWKPGAM
jgi:hypothetical protein